MEDFIIGRRRLEVSDAVYRLYGTTAMVVYGVLLSLVMYGLLWAFGTVFAASLAANVPTPLTNYVTCDNERETTACVGPYRAFLLLFAVIVVPLSLVDLREQRVVQMIMTGTRGVVLLVMIGTVVAAPACDGVAFAVKSGGEVDPAFVDRGMHVAEYFRPSGMGVLVPTTIFALIFHYSVPVLSHEVADKTALRGIFLTAFAVAAGSYVSLAIIVSTYFRDTVNTQCNLNWKDYVGCAASDAGAESASGWAKAARFFVLIFPAIDVLSGFPLNAITLGNNLLAAVMGLPAPMMESDERWVDTVCPAACRRRGQRYSAVEGDVAAEEAARVRRRQFRLKLLFRLLAAVPPLVGAFFISDLGKILDFTGLFAIPIATLVPCILWHGSRVRCQRALAAWESRGGAPSLELTPLSGTVSPATMEAEVEEPTDTTRLAVSAAPARSASPRSSIAAVALVNTPYHSTCAVPAVVAAVAVAGVVLFVFVFASMVRAAT